MKRGAELAERGRRETTHDDCIRYRGEQSLRFCERLPSASETERTRPESLRGDSGEATMPTVRSILSEHATNAVNVTQSHFSKQKGTKQIAAAHRPEAVTRSQ
jgi:hypothetical protein